MDTGGKKMRIINNDLVHVECFVAIYAPFLMCVHKKTLNAIHVIDYLTIRPFALKGHGSIAHSANHSMTIANSPLVA